MASKKKKKRITTISAEFPTTYLYETRFFFIDFNATNCHILNAEADRRIQVLALGQSLKRFTKM